MAACKCRDRDAIDFMPDADSVLNALPHPLAGKGMTWAACFFALFLGWSAFGKVDVIVQAPGKVVSDHPTVAVKPPDRGAVKSILVHVGDRVHAGQDLALFDPVFSRADVERLSAQAASSEAKRARLQAEFEEREYDPPNPQGEELVQRRLFLDRKQFRIDKEEFFRHEIDRIEKSHKSYSQNLGIQRQRLADMESIEAIMVKGSSSGAVSKRERLASRLERRQLEAEVRDKENALSVLDSELLAKQSERNAFRRDWSIGIADELAKAEEAATTAQKELDKAEQSAAYTSLKAPEDAVVHEVMPVSEGSAVRDAETLMTLVPLGGRLEVEAEVKAGDIGRIKEGDMVRVKVTAFPFQKHGTLEGRIRYVSEDAFQKDSKGDGSPAVPACYRVRIELTGQESGPGRILKKIIPGMEVEAEIKTGKRSILSYFTYPLTKALDESIREP